MTEQPVWFPHGSRMSAPFAAIDLAIPRLSGFVSDVARSLRGTRSLSQAVRAAATRHPAAAHAFQLDVDDAELEQNFALIDSLTFPNETLPAHIAFQRGREHVSLQLDPLTAQDVQSLLSACGSGRTTASEIRRACDEPVTSLFEALLRLGIVIESPPPQSLQVATAREPGVTRLQHAGLLYRGHGAGILVDPHLHSWYEPEGLATSFQRSQFEGLVDAVVLSHSHHDHFHLPTLMSFSKDTLMVVPRVTRPSLLCPDFTGALRALGFRRVQALGWGDPPVQVGDLELHALPFYGEQPLRNEAPRCADLRNVGNTYVVRHPSYVSWFLIDSGTDWLGSMIEVAHHVREKFGRIDLLVGNLREFSIGNPMYITGEGHYWLALSADQIRRFSSLTSQVLTLGPADVAEICRIVQARQFLPYAHWWEAVGTRGEEELASLARLAAHLSELGAPTSIFPWCIGDSYLPESDRPG